MRLAPLFAATLLFAPANLAAGSDQAERVAETVTFQLLPGTDEAQFLAAAKDTMAVMNRVGGALSRTLSKDEDGQWTDYIIWSDMQTATEAPAQIMADPTFAVFMGMIQDSSVDLQYSTVLWQMD